MEEEEVFDCRSVTMAALCSVLCQAEFVWLSVCCLEKFCTVCVSVCSGFPLVPKWSVFVWMCYVYESIAAVHSGYIRLFHRSLYERLEEWQQNITHTLWRPTNRVVFTSDMSSARNNRAPSTKYILYHQQAGSIWNLSANALLTWFFFFFTAAST